MKLCFFGAGGAMRFARQNEHHSGPPIQSKLRSPLVKMTREIASQLNIDYSHHENDVTDFKVDDDSRKAGGLKHTYSLTLFCFSATGLMTMIVTLPMLNR